MMTAKCTQMQTSMHTDDSPHQEQYSISWPSNPPCLLQTPTGIMKLRLIRGPLCFVFTSPVFSFQGMGQPCKRANVLMGTVLMPHCFAGSALVLEGISAMHISPALQEGPVQPVSMQRFPSSFANELTSSSEAST